MPRPKPAHRNPTVTFRALQPVVDEITAAAVARGKALGCDVTRTELMQLRNEYARRHMPLDWTPAIEALATP